jgi:hypothetical protein
MRAVVLWCLVSIIAASIYSAVRWGTEDESDTPENDDAVRERMERMRDAGSEVGL